MMVIRHFKSVVFSGAAATENPVYHDTARAPPIVLLMVPTKSH